MARSRWLTGLLFLFLACAGIVFYRNCVVNGGGDFRVYWNIARRVLDGGPTYLPAVDIPMAFKYPPWCLAPILPLAQISFESARAIWALLSVLAMFASFVWIVRKADCTLGSLCVALALQWGIWGGQFNHGQINVLVLAGLLWFWRPDLPSASLFRSVGLLFVASTKIISVFPLLYFRNPLAWLRAVAVAAVVFAVMSIPSLRTAESPLQLLAAWKTVAGSAVQGFGPEFARGRMNQGLPVVFGRVIDFHSMSDTPELIGFIVVSIVLAVAWRRFSRGLAPEESWAGWVAWICLVGPLSWSHNFVLALPLQVLALDRSWKSGQRRLIALAIVGLVCSGLVTFNSLKAIGALFGVPDALVPLSMVLEHASIKSIGVLLCAAALVIRYSSSPQRSR